jgi:hypothetical protein
MTPAFYMYHAYFYYYSNLLCAQDEEVNPTFVLLRV